MSRQTDGAQATTATRQYDAFGMLVASTGTPQGPFGFVGGWGYQGDADSGLKLLGHRYYDPSTGRFLTRDPVKDGRNWYSYCENEPLELADPGGLDDGPYTLKVPKLEYGPPMFNYPFPPASNFPPLGYPKPANPPSGPGIGINPGTDTLHDPVEVPVGGKPKPSPPSITITVPGPSSGMPVIIVTPPGRPPFISFPGGGSVGLPGGGRVTIGPSGGGSVTLPIPIRGGGSVTITPTFGPHAPPGLGLGLKIPF